MPSHPKERFGIGEFLLKVTIYMANHSMVGLSSDTGCVDVAVRPSNIELWLRSLLPMGGYVAIFSGRNGDLNSYFDESMDSGNLPMMTVAGYLFERDAYAAYDAEITKLFDGRIEYFRATECFHRAGEFANFPEPSTVPEEIERGVIKLTREHAVFGVGVAVSEATYNLLLPMHSEVIMGGAYSMLCQWCLQAMSQWTVEHPFTGEIVYNFEAGCKDQADANRDLNEIAKRPEFASRYRYGGHGFYPKRKFKGLQSADLLAYFCRREAQEQKTILSGDVPRNRRKDFQALIGFTENELRIIPHKFKYFHEEALKAFFSQDDNSDVSMRWYQSATEKKQ